MIKIILFLVIMKLFFLGGDFNIYFWIKDGKKYWDWYNNRETYKRG